MAKLSALPLITSLTGLFMVPAVNMTGTKVTERISAADFRTSLFAASASFNATDVLNLGATPPTDGAINVDGTGFTYGIRVSNGNITAPTFVGALTGNADTATLASTASLATNATLAAHATALATPRLINGVAFDGTANITLSTAVLDLTGDVTTVGSVSSYAGNFPVALLNSGTGASSSTYWRGDGTWATISSSGNVNNSGTPTVGQTAEWTNATTIQGVAVTGTGSYVKGTAPTIAGGTHTGLTGLAVRSTGAAFDLTFASSEVLTAGRTLSFVLGDTARSLTIGASASVSGSNTGDQTTVSGNAGSATVLATARAINGVNFDGSAAITVTAAMTAIAATQASDVTVTGITQTGTAGEALVFGDVCYLKSDGKVWKADANAAGLYPAILMATGTISANASGTFLRVGQARQDSWNWTIGGVVYLSTTAGSMTQTQPSATDDVIQVLGVAFPNADTVQFQPSLDYITHT